MRDIEQRDFLARLARQASAEPSLPATWRRDGGWLLAPSGEPHLSLGFAVRRHDAGTYVHIVRDARTERLIAQLQDERSAIEDAFGGPLKWGAPRGDRRYQVYATLDRAGYASERRRWVAAIDKLVRTMIRLHAAVSTRLEATNPQVAAIAHAVRPRGRGRGLTAAQRRAVEQHAVDVATRHFTLEGWTVEDVGAARSYDLHCSRGDAVLRVEVKGTTGPLDVIILTANEIALADAHYPDTALYVLTGIALAGSGREPMTRGGEAHLISPWQPEHNRMRALAYSYKLH